MQRSALLLTCVLLAVGPASAKVASIEFSDLVEASELIGVGEVTAVRKTIFGKRIAKAEIVESWKGAASTIEFLASPTWICDITGASVGEKLVLFLARTKKGRDRFEILWAGRGGMPLRETETGVVVDFWPEVLFPDDATTLDGPEPDFAFIRSIRLADLRAMVEESSGPP